MTKPIIAAIFACFIMAAPACADDLVIPPSSTPPEAAATTTPAAPPAEAGKPDPRYCEAVEDCTIVYGRCGRKAAMNISAAKEEQKKQDALKREDETNQVTCSFIDERIAGDMHCEKNTCKLDLATPKFFGPSD